MVKKNKKVQPKKSPRKRLTKSQVERGVKVLRAKKKSKSMDADIIFDSTLGRTDALFVDNPKIDMPVSTKSDEAINEALKEFDELPEIKTETPDFSRPMEIPNIDSQLQQNQKVVPEDKKPWWKKYFGGK